MGWLLIILYALLIAPVRVGAALRWEGKTPTLRVGVMIWGFRLQTELRGRRDEAGRLRLVAGFGRRSLPLPAGKRKGGEGIKALALLLRSNQKRAGLRRVIRVRALDFALQIGGENAALTALASGFFQALNPLVPKARILCRPAFHGRTRLYARCIAEARLGILWAAWLRWRAGRGSGQKEEQAWSILSGT